MPRRAKAPGVESTAELARKVEILERELALQQVAIDRLKQMAARAADRECEETLGRPDLGQHAMRW